MTLSRDLFDCVVLQRFRLESVMVLMSEGLDETWTSCDDSVGFELVEKRILLSPNSFKEPSDTISMFFKLESVELA